MKCVFVCIFTIVILFSTFLSLTECRGRGGGRSSSRGRSGSRSSSSSSSRSSSSSGSSGTSGSSGSSSSSGTSGLLGSSGSSGSSGSLYRSSGSSNTDHASHNIGFKPEYTQSKPVSYGTQGVNQGIGFKPEYTQPKSGISGSYGNNNDYGIKPEYTGSLGSQGTNRLGSYLEYPNNLNSPDFGFKPEYSLPKFDPFGHNTRVNPNYNRELEKMGIKLTDHNLGSLGAAFKPFSVNYNTGFKHDFDSNLRSQGIGFKPEYTKPKLEGLEPFNPKHNIDFKPDYTQPGIGNFNPQHFGTGFKTGYQPNYGNFPQNNGFKSHYSNPLYGGVNYNPQTNYQQPPQFYGSHYGKPSIPMIIPVPIGSSNTHYIHYYNDRSPYSDNYYTDRSRDSDDYSHPYRGNVANYTGAKSVNPGFIDRDEISPYYKPGYILPNKNEEAGYKAWRQMILKKFGSTSTTITSNYTTTSTSSPHTQGTTISNSTNTRSQQI